VFAILLVSCGLVGDAPTELCDDGWRRPVGECPEVTVPSTDTGDTGKDRPCTFEITSIDPGDGEEHYRRSPIRVQFSSEPAQAQVRVDGADGESVLTGETLVWTSDEPLAWDTRFDAVVEHDCGRHEWSFRTSALGEPRTEEVLGRTWFTDNESMTVVEPPSVGAVLGQYVGILLVEVVEHDGDRLVLRTALTQDDGSVDQDLCNPTLDFEVDFSDDPWFHFPAQDVTIAGSTLNQLEFSGTFSADGTGIGGVAGSAIVDTREWVFLIGEEEEDDALCNLMAGFGVECTLCDDEQELCMPVAIQDGEGHPADAGIVPIEVCDDSCSDEECEGCGCASKKSGGAWFLGLLTLLVVRHSRR